MSRVVLRNCEPPINTADAYNGMLTRMMIDVEYWRNGDPNLLPRRSGNVIALIPFPIFLTCLP